VAPHISGRPLEQIAWDPRQQTGYAAALAAPAIVSQLAASSGVAAAGDVDAADALLQAAVTAAALTAVARRSTPGSGKARSRRPNHNAPLFDAECRAQRAYWRARRSTAAAGGFRVLKRYFKSLVRSKRRQHLHDLRRNPRQPWREFNHTRPAVPPALGSPDQWFQFQQRFATHQPPASCHLPAELHVPSYSQEAADQLNVATITSVEVLAALARLHNGRASGVSELPAEIYRYAVAPAAENDVTPPQLLAPVLANLFTAAFAAGAIPAS